MKTSPEDEHVDIPVDNTNVFFSISVCLCLILGSCLDFNIQIEILNLSGNKLSSFKVCSHFKFLLDVFWFCLAFYLLLGRELTFLYDISGPVTCGCDGKWFKKKKKKTSILTFVFVQLLALFFCKNYCFQINLVTKSWNLSENTHYVFLLLLHASCSVCYVTNLRKITACTCSVLTVQSLAATILKESSLF